MISVLNLDHAPQVEVRYAESFSPEEPYKLLEVDDAILQELLENGLTIKGDPDDEAVLCTSKGTYAMKFVSTSNTVLLVPPLKGGTRSQSGDTDEGVSKEPAVGVVATASGHIELVETAPKVEKLRDLVSQHPYRDDDMNVDEECDGQLFTWDQLSAGIQASDYQLREELRKLDAVEIGRYWRVVDPGYMHNLLEILLSTAVQEDWSLTALPGSEVVRRLEADSFPPQVVISCLDKFGTRVDSACKEDGPTSHGRAATGGESTSDSGTAIWALDEEKICLHYARMLFEAQPVWKLEGFMEQWSVVTPSWTSPSLSMLRGEALVEKIGLESWLHQFSSSLLPMRPDARFTALFSRRPKWEWEGLEPYLRELKIPGQTVEAMLLKYTRKSQPTPTSTPVYTAR